MGVRGAFWWAVATVVVAEAVSKSGFEGIPGDYCRNRRPTECCDDRWDDCSVPIQGSACYSDEFCLNDDHNILNDCCPDFEEVCLGVKAKPPPPPPVPPAEIIQGDDPNQGQERKLNEISGFAGIPGSYCKNRKPSECCSDRWDDCAVPIQDSVCYCDEFCLKGPHDKLNDCCPDFEDVCLGGKGKPPAPLPFQEEDPNQECAINGIKIPLGDSHIFNCNKCTCTGATVECEKDQCMIEADLIQGVNAHVRHHGWIATNYTDFWGRKAKDGLELKTGTRIPSMEIPMHPVLLRPDMTQIPRHFDARVAWDGRLTGVRDQGWCGSSWAFSTLAVAQDRLNIMAKGIVPVALSPQHLLSCSKLGHDDCQTGQVDRAWNYLRLRGVVMDECFHYESGSSGKVPKCAKQQEAEANDKCMNVYRTEPPYRISAKEEDIQWEILTNGPVQAMMKVYPDLFVYETGVYRHTGLGGEASSSHSVKIIGWGQARINGHGMVKYWLVQNSWGRNWGERGFFRIRRGVNECGIESFVVAARARIGNPKYGQEIPYTVKVNHD